MVLLAGALPCRAQEKNRFALGVNYTHRLANDEGAHGNGGVGIKWRLGHSEEGWGRQIGLGWFTSDIDRSVAGATLRFGELKVRPFVAGYGYTYSVNRRLHITGDLVGGLAFTSFELEGAADSALRAVRPGALDVDVTRVIPVLRPEVSLWYDVHPKFGVSVGAGYTFARPRLTITSSGSRETERLRADTFAVSGGIVYRLF
jgi:hypothetical protein